MHLEVGRQYRLCDGPTDDGELCRPRTSRFRSAESILEFNEFSADVVKITSLCPSRSPCFEGLPIFVAGVLISDFCRVNHERKPGFMREMTAANSRPYL